MPFCSPYPHHGAAFINDFRPKIFCLQSVIHFLLLKEGAQAQAQAQPATSPAPG